jgi:hypothetical protein
MDNDIGWFDGSPCANASPPAPPRWTRRWHPAPRRDPAERQRLGWIDRGGKLVLLTVTAGYPDYVRPSIFFKEE